MDVPARLGEVTDVGVIAEPAGRAAELAAEPTIPPPVTASAGTLQASLPEELPLSPGRTGAVPSVPSVMPMDGIKMVLSGIACPTTSLVINRAPSPPSVPHRESGLADKRPVGKDPAEGGEKKPAEPNDSTKAKSSTTRTSGERCKHGKFRSRCKDCFGAVLCVHGKRRCECAECGGSSLCVHNRRKYSCKECGGSQYCSHDKIKRRSSLHAARNALSSPICARTSMPSNSICDACQPDVGAEIVAVLISASIIGARGSARSAEVRRSANTTARNFAVRTGESNARRTSEERRES